jgi:phosphoribosylformylglycinamidine synthase
MAGRAGTGLELDLDAIPRRTRALSPYEMLLSESQERMLMVAKPGREQEVFDLCAKWDLEAAIVGRVTNTSRFVCHATPGYDPLDDTPIPQDPVVVVNIPIDALTDAAPKYDRPQERPPRNKGSTTEMTAVSVGRPESLVRDAGAELLRMIGSPNIGSRRWIYRQYDHIVRDGTVLRPGESDAAVVRVFCEDGDRVLEKYIALSVDGNGRHVELEPFHGAAMAVAECARNVVCAGAKPLGLTDCLNFGSPKNPETMWRFARAIDGIKAACEALDTPVVSGNVSLYNETDGVPILPTPSVAVVGLLADADDRLGLGFVRDGAVIAHLGKPSEGNLGGSEWLTQHTGRVTGDPQRIDLDEEQRLQNAVLALARARVLDSAHDVSDGGIAVCIAESCIASGLGASVRLVAAEDRTIEASMFAEEPSRVIVSFAPRERAEVERICAIHGVDMVTIGAVGGSTLTLEGLCAVAVEALAASHGSALDAIVGAH